MWQNLSWPIERGVRQGMVFEVTLNAPLAHMYCAKTGRRVRVARHLSLPREDAKLLENCDYETTYLFFRTRGKTKDYLSRVDSSKIKNPSMAKWANPNNEKYLPGSDVIIGAALCSTEADDYCGCKSFERRHSYANCFVMTDIILWNTEKQVEVEIEREIQMLNQVGVRYICHLIRLGVLGDNWSEESTHFREKMLMLSRDD